MRKGWCGLGRTPGLSQMDLLFTPQVSFAAEGSSSRSILCPVQVR
jgi:hypothetical protein